MSKQEVYIGNTTQKGVYKYVFIEGKLIQEYETKDTGRCTYLTQNKTHLYGVTEIKDGSIISYEKDSGKLKYIGKNFSNGEGPCHIEIDDKNKVIFVSHYNNGVLAVFRIKENGEVGEKIYSKVENARESRMHCIKTSIDNKYFFAVDLGKDRLTAYEIKENTIKEIDNIEFKKNTQPRHIALSKRNIYVITEKSCELYKIKFSNQKLQITDIVSLLPNDVEIKENYTGCAIKITKDFKNIYTTIRGHNSISVYKINENAVELIQNICCEGDLPRDLEIDKEEKYLLIANSNSNEIAVFKRNKNNGKLKFCYKENIVAPTCIIVE